MSVDRAWFEAMYTKVTRGEALDLDQQKALVDQTQETIEENDSAQKLLKEIERVAAVSLRAERITRSDLLELIEKIVEEHNAIADVVDHHVGSEAKWHHETFEAQATEARERLRQYDEAFELLKDYDDGLDARVQAVLDKLAESEEYKNLRDAARDLIEDIDQGRPTAFPLHPVREALRKLTGHDNAHAVSLRFD